MFKFSIIAFVIGLAFALTIHATSLAQTNTPTPMNDTSPSPTRVIPTSAPATGRG